MSRILIIILIHAIGDFFLQGYKLSNRKTSKIIYLLEHVGIYTILFVVLSPILLGLTFFQGLAFSLLNGGLHFVIDYVTGKYKSKYFSTDEFNYIKTIGIDHTLHLLILISTYFYLYPSAANSFTPLFKYLSAI